MNKLTQKGWLTLFSPLFISLMIGITYILSSRNNSVLSLYIYLLSLSFLGIVGNLILALKKPDFLNERNLNEDNTMKRIKQIKLVYLLGITILLPYVAGYDARVNGSLLNIESFYIGLILFVLTAVFAIKVLSDSPYLRLSFGQKEINQKGFYRFMRHPSYTALLLFTIEQALCLRSRLSFWISILLVILIFIKVYKEDKCLQNSSQVYQNYCEDVKDRLIPYIW